MYCIEISGSPVAKSRPRGYRTKQGGIRFYTPVKSQRFENIVRERAEKVFTKPLGGPLRMVLVFLLPRPKRLIWKKRPMMRVACDKKPDVTNLAKSVEDGLNGVAYRDDAQIVDLHVSKFYHAGDEWPQVLIELEEVE